MLWLTTSLLALAWQAETPRAQEAPPVEAPAPKQRGVEDKKRGGERQKDPRRMTREEAQRWWEGLSEEERQQARERMQRFREMSPEARRELQRRAELLRAVGEEVVAGMAEVQRKDFDALPREERARVHRELVRAKLKELGENIDGWEDFPQRGAFEDRLRHSREKREEGSEKRRQRELDRAVDEGWLSAKAVERLRAGSPEKMKEALDQVRQWRMIEHFDKKGLWEKLKIDETEQGRLKELPPREFLDEMRKRSAHWRKRDKRGGEGPPPEHSGEAGKGGRPDGGRRGGHRD